MTGGNPARVIETIRHLSDGDSIDVNPQTSHAKFGRSWQGMSTDPFVSDTIRSRILTQIESLPSTPAIMLKLAAIVGTLVVRDLLLHLVQKDKQRAAGYEVAEAEVLVSATELDMALESLCVKGTLTKAGVVDGLDAYEFAVSCGGFMLWVLLASPLRMRTPQCLFSCRCSWLTPSRFLLCLFRRRPRIRFCCCCPFRMRT